MLTQLCAEIRNYFLRDYQKDIHKGTFTVSGGSIESLPFLQEGQYFRVKGSVFNDGVWKYGEPVNMKDETFSGEIWAMAVPNEVINLSNEIDVWVELNADALSSPFQAESFGGYSYSKNSGASGYSGSSTAYTWQNQFANDLGRYRRISEL